MKKILSFLALGAFIALLSFVVVTISSGLFDTYYYNRYPMFAFEEDMAKCEDIFRNARQNGTIATGPAVEKMFRTHKIKELPPVKNVCYFEHNGYKGRTLAIKGAKINSISIGEKKIIKSKEDKHTVYFYIYNDAFHDIVTAP